MKQSILLLAVLGMICGLMTGCALFHDHQSGSANTPGGQGSASAQGGSPEAGGQTNQSTATITSGGTITTTVSGGTVTTVANNGPGGGASAPGGMETATAATGHGPLFYFYLLFAAAVVIWLVWAIWHSYHRRAPARVHYRRRRAV